jgi:hypothetical protein
MNYHPLTWLTWFAWGFFMGLGWLTAQTLEQWIQKRICMYRIYGSFYPKLGVKR